MPPGFYCVTFISPMKLTHKYNVHLGMRGKWLKFGFLFLFYFFAIVFVVIQTRIYSTFKRAPSQRLCSVKAPPAIIHPPTHWFLTIFQSGQIYVNMARCQRQTRRSLQTVCFLLIDLILPNHYSVYPPVSVSSSDVIKVIGSSISAGP